MVWTDPKADENMRLVPNHKFVRIKDKVIQISLMLKLPYTKSGVEVLKASVAALIVKNIDPCGFTKGC